MKKIVSLEQLRDFQRSGTAGIHQELALYLREKIFSGVLTPGEQLPSLRDLAVLWKTNPFSVRLAMDDLVCRGLLNRQQGRGMFVASSVREIRRIGIYCSQEFRLSRDLLAFFYLRDALSRRLRELQFEFCFLDDRASLHDAVLGNRIQAVAGVVVSTRDKKWFNSLPIRKVVFMRDPLMDFDRIARALAEHRCRRVAAIVPAATPGDGIPVSFLITGLKSAGVRIMPRNLRTISPDALSGSTWDKVGYEKTLELLTSPLRPDALIVYPDNAVPGVIQAILKLGIKVPEELFAVFHRNVELPYFCSLDAFYLDMHLSGFVDKLVESLIHTEENQKPMPERRKKTTLRKNRKVAE